MAAILVPQTGEFGGLIFHLIFLYVYKTTDKKTFIPTEKLINFLCVQSTDRKILTISVGYLLFLSVSIYRRINIHFPIGFLLFLLVEEKLIGKSEFPVVIHILYMGDNVVPAAKDISNAYRPSSLCNKWTICQWSI